MATPLDAERARLRAEGHSEGEISQILINRASGNGSQQPAGPAPVQGGNMSGVLGNASAVLSHMKGTIPVLKADLTNLSSSTAPPKSRAKSFAVLAFAAVIAAVLAFAVYQEWQRHIIFETEIQKEQAASAHAKSCLERGSNFLRRDSAGYRQWVLDCPDYFSPDVVKAATNPPKPAKEKSAVLTDEAVLSHFSAIEPKFKELTHSDGNLAVRLCTYRAALQLISGGYDQEDAVRVAAKHCPAERAAEAKP
jgi:hypothetical protein